MAVIKAWVTAGTVSDGRNHRLRTTWAVFESTNPTHELPYVLGSASVPGTESTALEVLLASLGFTAMLAVRVY